MLEDRPGVYVDEPHRFVVRVVFQKVGPSWLPVVSDCGAPECLTSSVAAIPQQTSWTISLQGRRLGTVSAHAPDAWRGYADVGTQELASERRAPTDGVRSMDFAGWSGEPVFRPLVATSPAAVHDPDSWAAAPLPMALGEKLRREFRARFPNVANCTGPEENVERPILYADADIEISETYASSAGWRLATLNLNNYGCDGPLNENSAFLKQVFAVSPAGQALFLGEGLQFIDAGDFDQDSKSETLFAISGYNRGGYELRYDDFASSAVFSYGYH